MNIVLIVLLTIHKNIPFPLKIHHELLSTLKEKSILTLNVPRRSEIAQALCGRFSGQLIAKPY